MGRAKRASESGLVYYVLNRANGRLNASCFSWSEPWRWGSLWHWNHGGQAFKGLLSAWPVRRSPKWLDYVNTPETEGEFAAVRNCVKRGSPYGTDSWCDQMVKTPNLETTVNPRGRPKLNTNGSCDAFSSPDWDLYPPNQTPSQTH